MKLITLFTLLFSLSAFAQDSQKCVNTVNKGRDFLAASIEDMNLAKEKAESVEDDSDLEFVCGTLREMQFLIINARMNIKTGRLTTQDAILYCNSIENKKVIIQNLNAAYDLKNSNDELFDTLIESMKYYSCIE